jgi:hypothetical protein
MEFSIKRIFLIGLSIKLHRSSSIFAVFGVWKTQSILPVMANLLKQTKLKLNQNWTRY